MTKAMYNLIDQYIEESKKFMITCQTDYFIWFVCQRRFQTRLRYRYYDFG